MNKWNIIEIEIPEWIRHGTGMLRRRSALPPEHPESEYNYVIKTYPGIDPTKFGIKAPKARDRCDKCGRDYEDEY